MGRGERGRAETLTLHSTVLQLGTPLAFACFDSRDAEPTKLRDIPPFFASPPPADTAGAAFGVAGVTFVEVVIVVMPN